MIMARVIILAVVVVVSMFLAWIFRSVTDSMLSAIQTTFTDIGITASTFEIAIITLIPYIALVYLAIVRPVVDFWANRKD